MKRRTWKNSGFSLVELIIVIAIMAILAGALAPALIKYVKKSRLQVYLDTASEIEKSVVNMVVDAEEDGYAIRAVTYKGSTEDGSGNGTLICANGSGYADMASAADKAKVFFRDVPFDGNGKCHLIYEWRYTTSRSHYPKMAR